MTDRLLNQYRMAIPPARVALLWLVLTAGLPSCMLPTSIEDSDAPSRPMCLEDRDCIAPTRCMAVPGGAHVADSSLRAQSVCDTDSNGNSVPDLVDFGWVPCQPDSGIGDPPCFRVSALPARGLDSACGFLDKDSPSNKRFVDCSAGLLCLSGRCVDARCGADSDCPKGQTCMFDDYKAGMCGTGKLGAACATSSHCLPEQGLTCVLIEHDNSTNYYQADKIRFSWALYAGAGVESACTDGSVGAPCAIVTGEAVDPGSKWNLHDKTVFANSLSNCKIASGVRCLGTRTDKETLPGLKFPYARLGVCTAVNGHHPCQLSSDLHSIFAKFACSTSDLLVPCCTPTYESTAGEKRGCGDSDCTAAVAAEDPTCSYQMGYTYGSHWPEHCAQLAQQLCPACIQPRMCVVGTEEGCMAKDGAFLCSGVCGPTAPSGNQECASPKEEFAGNCANGWSCLDGKCWDGSKGSRCEKDGTCQPGLSCFGGYCG